LENEMMDQTIANQFPQEMVKYQFQIFMEQTATKVSNLQLAPLDVVKPIRLIVKVST